MYRTRGTFQHVTLLVAAGFLTALLLPTVACGRSVPNGQRRFVSTHGTFEYLIPADWGAVAANSYGAGSSKVIEEIYPASEINAEYCRSFVYVGDGDYEAGAVENEVYDNGHVQGCLIVWDVRNVQQGTEWRHISFVFFHRGEQ